MSLQKLTAITLCAAAIGFPGCRDPFADCLPGYVDLGDGDCGLSGSSTSAGTDPTTTSGNPVCGNGMPEGTEQCDDGNQIDNDACGNDCNPPVCGDGDVEGNELCDDGNLVDNDGCNNACKVPVCGDGKPEGAEQCDDGNQIDNDACNNACKVPSVCGDGKPGGAEECDDGNQVDNDGCGNDCKLPVCGDGTPEGSEKCDDGNQIDDDLCGNDCMEPECGDGIREGGEQCDDGNQVDGDMCSNDCTTPDCGNGEREGAEECDDGDGDNKNGCSNTCFFPRVAFATSAIYTGNLGGVAGADVKCSTLAGVKIPAPQGATWRAWLSTTTESPLTRFDRYFTGLYLRADGALIAEGWGGLIGEALTSPINLDESKQALAEPLASWSNTTAAGESSGAENCNGWNASMGKPTGRYGDVNATNISWTNDEQAVLGLNPTTCAVSLHLYCFQDIPFRFVFVTSARFTGALDGLSGADNKCEQAAKAAVPPLPGSWKAWLSDATESPKMRFDKNFTGWYRLPDGTPVARGWAELADGSAGITRDENGQILVDPQRAWSNTNADGSKASNDHCNNWMTGTLPSKGRFGNFRETSSYWTDDTHVSANPAGCSEQFHLYCIQDGP